MKTDDELDDNADDGSVGDEDNDDDVVADDEFGR